MCNQSAAELIARLKRLIRRMCRPKGIVQEWIPKAGARFQHRHKGHMVTVITQLRKTFPTGKPAGLLAGWGYVSFYGYTMRFRYEQSGV
jgi:hypothetical protein